MKAVWKGSINFGLLNLEIKLYPATTDKTIKFRLLHKECLAPIRYDKVCTKCGKKVEKEEIVKGFEYAPGKFVPITEEELSTIRLPSLKVIQIVQFVNLEEIDPIFFHKSYYAVPSPEGMRAYQLLRDAMKNRKKVGIGKVAMRGKEYLVVIRPVGDAIVVETMFYPDEINEVPPILHEAVQYTAEELKMAEEIVEKLTSPFLPSKFKDEYRERLMELIKSKIPKTEPKKEVGKLLTKLQKTLKEIEKD